MNEAATHDLAGLRIKLHPCRACKCDTARIVGGEWRTTPFVCEQCGRERGRLNEMTQHFIGEFIKLFGRPSSPIEIRQSHYLKTSPQPSGAAVGME